MINIKHSAAIIIVIAVCTFFTRCIPFLIFGTKREVPKVVQYLGNVLPPAIMATLVVYCLKSVNIFQGNRGIPEFLSVTAVAALHIWKKNTLLSIAGGTVCYMLMIQKIFIS